jgi:hypothetical protein
VTRSVDELDTNPNNTPELQTVQLSHDGSASHKPGEMGVPFQRAKTHGFTGGAKRHDASVHTQAHSFSAQSRAA